MPPATDPRQRAPRRWPGRSIDAQNPFEGAVWTAWSAKDAAASAERPLPPAIRVDRGSRSWKAIERAWWTQLHVDEQAISAAVDAAWGSRFATFGFGNSFGGFEPPKSSRLDRINRALHRAAGGQVAALLGWPQALRPQPDCELQFGGGAPFHHDPDFNLAMFVVTFLRVDAGAWLEIPRLAMRVPLSCGTSIVLDPLLVHGITHGEGRMGRARFMASVTALNVPAGLRRHLKSCSRLDPELVGSDRIDVESLTGELKPAKAPSRRKRPDKLVWEMQPQPTVSEDLSVPARQGHPGASHQGQPAAGV